jgi:hypothetical protein
LVFTPAKLPQYNCSRANRAINRKFTENSA